jgi:hypothetical protein
MDADRRETLQELAERAARCPEWRYLPGMAILPVEHRDGCEPVRIVHVEGDGIWLFDPERIRALGVRAGLVRIEASLSPCVDLSDPTTFAAAESLMCVRSETINGIRALVQELEDDLPF